MRRSGYALAVAAILVLAVAVFGAASTALSQGDPTSTVISIPPGVYCDAVSGLCFSVGTTATPTGTFTPTPTHTPPATVTPLPTNTPRATATPLYNTPATMPPSLTPTPFPSATPVFPTPTPDVLPSVTPGPSSTPQTPPDEALCFAGTQYNLNIRVGPNTSFAIVGKLAQFDRVLVDALYIYDAANEWAHLADGRGWIALWYAGDHLAHLDDNDACWTLPQSGPGAQPPPSIAGLHTLFDTREYSTNVLTRYIGTLKTTTGSQKLGAAFKVAQPGGLWVHRELSHDHPAIYEWLQPGIFVDRIQGEWTLGADYYEIINETTAPTWEMFADFTIGVLEAATQRGVCIAWGSFGPGNPDFPAWAELVRVIEWADTHPCRPGRYHAIAVHGPLYMPGDIPRQAGRWMDNPYIVDRLSYVDGLVRLYTGKGLAGHKGGAVLVTEIGLDDGYSGSWSDVWSCEDIARSLWHTVDVTAARYPYVIGLHLWTFGDGLSIWTDRQDCADVIAQRVQ